METGQCLERDTGTGLFGMDVPTMSCSLCLADRVFLLSKISELAKVIIISLGAIWWYLVKKLVISAVNNCPLSHWHSPLSQRAELRLWRQDHLLAPRHLCQLSLGAQQQQGGEMGLGCVPWCQQSPQPNPIRLLGHSIRRGSGFACLWRSEQDQAAVGNTIPSAGCLWGDQWVLGVGTGLAGGGIQPHGTDRAC